MTKEPPTAEGLCANLLTRCRFPPRTALACAVSGGADSAALLILAVAAGIRVEAIHVDHGLRDHSAEEAEAVRRLAAGLGASFRSVAVHIEHGSNLEARAREVRYRALPDDVATGHTMDDVAETVVLNMLRGAGSDGLAPFTTRSSRCRPLLGLRRSETQALCAAFGYTPIHDEMNDDRRFRRVRVRHEVLPLLCDVAGRDVVPLLARQASLLASDDEVLNEQASMIDPADARSLAGAPVALAGRAVRRWLRREGVTSAFLAPSAVVDRVVELARGRGSKADLLGGWSVVRSHQRLHVVAPANSRGADQRGESEPEQPPKRGDDID